MEFLFLLVLVAFGVVRYLVKREQKDDTSWRPPTPRRRTGPEEPSGRHRTQTAPAHSLTEALARAEARREHDQREEVELRYDAVDDHEDRQPGDPIIEHIAVEEPASDDAAVVERGRAGSMPAASALPAALAVSVSLNDPEPPAPSEKPVSAEPASAELPSIEHASTATGPAVEHTSPSAAYSSAVYTPTSVYSTGYTSTSVYESGTSILDGTEADAEDEDPQDEKRETPRG